MSDKFKAWTDRAVAQMRFPWDRAGVRKELLAHLEDREYDYVNHGLTKEEAQANALAAIGDAVETGKLLNKAHSPLLGWAWLVSKLACIGLAVWFAGQFLFGFLLAGVSSEVERWAEKMVMEEPCTYYEEGDLLVESGLTLQQGDYTIVLDHGIVSQGESWLRTTLALRIWTNKPWQTAPLGLERMEMETPEGQIYCWNDYNHDDGTVMLFNLNMYDTGLPVWKAHFHGEYFRAYDPPEWLRFYIPDTDIDFTVWANGEVTR